MVVFFILLNYLAIARALIRDPKLLLLDEGKHIFPELYFLFDHSTIVYLH